jgi:hypothetical protein
MGRQYVYFRSRGRIAKDSQGDQAGDYLGYLAGRFDGMAFCGGFLKLLVPADECVRGSLFRFPLPAPCIGYHYGYGVARV